MIKSAMIAVVFAALAGCASAPEPPTDALSAARDAIASAERAGARQYSGAELDEANEKLANAERAVASEKMQEAQRLAEEARVAAELASARTEATKASNINRQLRQDADALEEEMERMGEQQ